MSMAWTSNDVVRCAMPSSNTNMVSGWTLTVRSSTNHMDPDRIQHPSSGRGREQASSLGGRSFETCADREQLPRWALREQILLLHGSEASWGNTSPPGYIFELGSGSVECAFIVSSRECMNKSQVLPTIMVASACACICMHVYNLGSNIKLDGDC